MEEEEFIYNMRSELEDKNRENMVRINELMEKGYSAERIARYLILEEEDVRKIMEESGLENDELVQTYHSYFIILQFTFADFLKLDPFPDLKN